MLKRLWILLFSSCQHEWITLYKTSVYRKETDELPQYMRLHLKCKKCADWRKVDLV